MRMSAGKVKVPMATRVGVKFADLEFYKVHTFTKDYQ